MFTLSTQLWRKIKARGIQLISLSMILAFLGSFSLDAFGNKGDDVLDGEWPVVGQDYNNLQKALSVIDSSNVDKAFGIDLEHPGGVPQFIFPATPGGIVAGLPSISNGVAYFGDTAGYFHAYDINSGLPIFSIPLGNEIITTPSVTKDIVYVSGSVFLGTFPNPVVKIFAINRSDGTILWSKPVAPTSGTLPGVTDYTGDTTVVGDLVIFGVANFENVFGALDYHARGQVVGLNRFDGSEVFRIFTTSDQNTSDPQYGGGVGVWSSAGVDIEREMIYLGSGQNFELPISPFQDALLAIDYKKGELDWFTQTNINDVWSPTTDPNGPDWDLNTHTNLFSVDIEGEGSVDFIGVGDKAGRYYIMRRDQKAQKTKEYSSLFSGKPVLSQEFETILYLDPGSIQGTIQATATIDDTNDILYVNSDALVGVNGDDVRVTLDAAQLFCNPNDFVCLQVSTVGKLAAYDLKKLLNGFSAPDSLLWENKSSADSTNHGQNFGPIAQVNDILITTNGTGNVRAIKQSDGSVLATAQPLGPYVPILGGVSVVGKQIFVPTLAGIVVYSLP